MPDVQIQGTNTTVSFPDTMSPDDIAKVMATHPMVQKMRGSAMPSPSANGPTTPNVPKPVTPAYMQPNPAIEQPVQQYIGTWLGSTGNNTTKPYQLMLQAAQKPEASRQSFLDSIKDENGKGLSQVGKMAILRAAYAHAGSGMASPQTVATLKKATVQPPAPSPLQRVGGAVGGTFQKAVQPFMAGGNTAPTNVMQPLTELDQRLTNAAATVGLTKGARAGAQARLDAAKKLGIKDPEAQGLYAGQNADPNFIANFAPGAAKAIRAVPVIGGAADFASGLISPGNAVALATLGAAGKVGKLGIGADAGAKAVQTAAKVATKGAGAGFAGGMAKGGSEQLVQAGKDIQQKGFHTDNVNEAVKGLLGLAASGLAVNHLVKSAQAGAFVNTFDKQGSAVLPDAKSAQLAVKTLKAAGRDVPQVIMQPDGSVILSSPIEGVKPNSAGIDIAPKSVDTTGRKINAKEHTGTAIINPVSAGVQTAEANADVSKSARAKAAQKVSGQKNANVPSATQQPAQIPAEVPTPAVNQAVEPTATPAVAPPVTPVPVAQNVAVPPAEPVVPAPAPSAFDAHLAELEAAAKARMAARQQPATPESTTASNVVALPEPPVKDVKPTPEPFVATHTFQADEGGPQVPVELRGQQTKTFVRAVMADGTKVNIPRAKLQELPHTEGEPNVTNGQASVRPTDAGKTATIDAKANTPRTVPPVPVTAEQPNNGTSASSSIPPVTSETGNASNAGVEAKPQLSPEQKRAETERILNNTDSRMLATELDKVGADSSGVRKIAEAWRKGYARQDNAFLERDWAADMQTAAEDALTKWEQEGVAKPSLKEKVNTTLDATEKAAQDRLKSKLGNANSGIDPESLKDLAILGSVKIARGAVKFADFSQQMVSEFGDAVRPHLQDLYAAAKDHYHSEIAPKFNLSRVPEDMPIKGQNIDMSAPKVEGEPTASNATALPEGTTRTKGANEHAAEERTKIGLEDLPQAERRPVADAFNEATRSGAATSALTLARKVISEPRPMTDVETAGLVQRMQQVKERVEALRDQIAKTVESGDTRKTDDLRAEHNVSLDEYDTLDKARKEAGRQWALSGLARQVEINNYDYVGVRKRMITANPKKPLTAVEDTRIGSLTDALKAANDKIAQHEQTIKDNAAQRSVQRMARENAQETRRTGRAKAKADLDTEFEQLRKQFVKAGSQLNSGIPAELIPIVAKMAKNRVAAGIVSIDGLVDNIHEALKDHVEGLTTRDIRDAISGYGMDTPKQTRSEALQSLADMRKQMRLISAIEDAEKGQHPAKGQAPGKPSAQVAKLRAQLDETMQKQGLKSKAIVSDEARLRSAKSQTKAKIDDLTRRIEEKNFSKPGTRPLPADAELTKLKADRDALQQQYQEMKPAAVRDPLPAIKTRLTKQIADMREQLKTNNFDKPEVVKPTYDAEVNRLKDERDKLKDQIDQTIAKRQVVTPADMLAKFQRFNILSGVASIGKLGAAAALRTASNPIEEVFGAGVSKIVPKLAAGAPREGGLNAKGEIDAVKTFLSLDSVSDAMKKLREGTNSLDDAYDQKKVSEARHEFKRGQGLKENGKAMFDFFGHLHGAIKTPAQRAEFTRSVAKRTAYYARNGADVTDPVTILKIGAEAYGDSKRAILMGDNLATNIYSNMLSYAKRQGPGGQAVAAGLQTLMPIVKVPTNYVSEATNYVGGSAIGAAKLMAANVRGEGGYKAGLMKTLSRDAFKDLTPEQSDAVLRAWKKHGVGVGLMALGYLQPGSFKPGGYYDPSNKDKAVEPGDFQFMGHTLPHTLAHSPALEAIQFGATLRRAMDVAKSKGQGKPEAGLNAIVKGSLGMMEQVPFIDQAAHVGSALRSSESAMKAAGEVAKSVVVPQVAQQAARYMDRDSQGKTVPRKQNGFRDVMQEGIPILRNRLPVKEPKSSGGRVEKEPTTAEEMLNSLRRKAKSGK